MAAAFFASTFLKNTSLAPILPYFDQIVAVLVVLFMVPQFIAMLSAVKSVFLFAPEQETVDQIKEITHQILTDTPYQTDFFDITRTRPPPVGDSVFFHTGKNDFLCSSCAIQRSGSMPDLPPNTTTL